MCSTHANGTKTKQGSLATHSGCNQWFIYQLSMVPSCDAGCMLLVTWFLAGYRVTKCLATGLSCDSSPLSLNPMRPLVFVRNPTHPARTPTIHLTVTQYFIFTKTKKGQNASRYTVFMDFRVYWLPGKVLYFRPNQSVVKYFQPTQGVVLNSQPTQRFVFVFSPTTSVEVYL